jgi:probable addiction module antidote protein
MPKRTSSYHSWLVEKLKVPQVAETYLRTALADSQEAFLAALRNVAEAHRMTKVAEGAGVNRESLYKALSEDGNPRFSTLDSVLNTLGMTLSVQLKQPVTTQSAPPARLAQSDEQNVAAAIETIANINITSTAPAGFRNVATVRSNLTLTDAMVTGEREQSSWTYAGTPLLGFIAHATGADQRSIYAAGD